MMGCSMFITTNSTGFVNQTMKMGDLALITDHVNFIHRPYDGGKIYYPLILIATVFDPIFHINENAPQIYSTSALYD